MPINRVRRKIHHLRRQPEDVRLRVASYVTVVGGVCLTLLWVTVLLPLQLRLSGGLGDEEVSQEESLQASNQSGDAQEPRVGGARDEVSASEQLFHVAPPQEEAQGTIINSPNRSGNEAEYTQPQNPAGQEFNNNQAKPSNDPESVDTIPVEVTE